MGCNVAFYCGKPRKTSYIQIKCLMKVRTGSIQRPTSRSALQNCQISNPRSHPAFQRPFHLALNSTQFAKLAGIPTLPVPHTATSFPQHLNANLPSAPPKPIYQRLPHSRHHALRIPRRRKCIHNLALNIHNSNPLQHLAPQ